MRDGPHHLNYPSAAMLDSQNGLYVGLLVIPSTSA